MCSTALVIDGDGIVVDTEDPWDVELRRMARAIAGPAGGFGPDKSDAELAAGAPGPRDDDGPRSEYGPRSEDGGHGAPMVRVSQMAPEGLLDELAALEQRIGAAQARQVELLAALARERVAYVEPAGPNRLPVVDYWREQVADEVAARLCWTRWQAARRTEEARRLQLCMPATLAALQAGQVDYPRVRVMVRATEDLNPADAAAVDVAVADRLGTLTTSALRAVLAKEVIAVDADAARRREQAATARRSVYFQPLPDAQAELRVQGPAATVISIAEALDTLAGPHAGADGDLLGARRFDALTAAVETAVDHHDIGSHDAEDVAESGVRRRTRRRPHVLVSVSLATLIGLDEDPADLAGYGPIPAHIARQLATHGVLRRVLTDPLTGVVVFVDGHTHPNGYTPHPPHDPGSPDDSGPPSGAPQGHGAPPFGAARTEQTCPVAAVGGGPYRPPTALARLVRLRDQHCSAIGCRLRADKCDLDHITAHPDGPTCACNLHPLCRRHHGMKHHTDWQVTRQIDGSRLWTSPTGHTYVEPARPFLDEPRILPPSYRARRHATPTVLAKPGYPATESEESDDRDAPPF